MERLSNELEVAISHLTSLNDGDRGVLEVVRIGTQAIPRLRTLLFQREPSGLFQSRCRVVDALAALNGRAVLAEFLQADRSISDPVERAGEEAVINAAARAARDNMDEALFQRLVLLAETRKLVGPIEVVGDTRRVEVLSCLIAALGDDLARPVAQQALRKFGGVAATVLIEAASVRIEPEHESARRRRRVAMQLLNEIDPSPATTQNLRDQWRRDPDIEIALLGCRMALKQGDTTECDRAAEQLIQMLGRADWRTRQETEAILSHSGYSNRMDDALARTAPACKSADRPSPRGAFRRRADG